MKIAVTGASGFIGRYLVEALLADGHQVVALGRAGSGKPAQAGGGLIAEETDYSEQSLTGIFAGLDAVVHLAGRRMTREDEPNRLAPFVEPNVLATENLMRAAKAAGASKVAIASTIAVYSARNEAPYRETEVPQPLNAYGLSKLMAEQYANLYAPTAGIVLTNLRFAAVYGHGEKGTPALMRFINEATEKRTLTLQGNRLISVDQLYVRDAVGAILAALDDKNPGGTFNIGCGDAYTVVEMAETVNSVFGNAGNLVTENSHEAPARKNRMDISHAAAVLGWRPRYGLAEGLSDFLATRDKACDR
ncbi:NAD(P)-dependent oxidoreductase [Mesorhizobium sp. LHD-90]|uniref:NAD-dependent epimerase/dehydratase family protein n=1 Tax=Mesorhizobium sp. LHD-90 TaxID=3071414 RepID=UPI0027E06FBF|nr:NAD(P)-dependent oxidoreductase [Mesorhizobium sp. LHD-90]MDQ6437588.1 NAD(P)-dependent oxidoreductase [Mesorhizobium sp. LHD-90]